MRWLILALFVATPALAQEEAASVLMERLRMTQARERVAEATYTIPSDDQYIATRKQINDLIAAGKCDDARHVAADYGEKGLIRRVAKKCP